METGIHFCSPVLVQSYPLWRMSAVIRHFFALFSLHPQDILVLPAWEATGDSTWEPCLLSFSSFKRNLLRRIFWRLWINVLWNGEHYYSEQRKSWKAQELILKNFYFWGPLVVLVCLADILVSLFIPWFWCGLLVWGLFGWLVGFGYF